MRNTWFFFAILSSLTAALVAVFSKVGLKKIDPVLATTVRSFLMALFLLIVSLSLKRFDNFSFRGLNSKEWLFIFLAALAGASSWLFYFLALKSGLAIKVAAIDRLSLVFVVIFASLFLGESLAWKSFIGVLLMIAGGILVALK
jgi:transporter family protein